MKRFLLKQISRDNIYKFSKFVTGGVFGYAINLMITFSLAELVGWYYLWSYAVGLICSILFNFAFAVKIIFNVKNNYRKIFTFYIISVGVFFVFNLLTVKYLSDIFKFDYKILVVVVTGFYLLLKYQVYDNFIFKIEKNG